MLRETTRERVAGRELLTTTNKYSRKFINVERCNGPGIFVLSEEVSDLEVHERVEDLLSLFKRTAAPADAEKERGIKKGVR